jgi:RNA polymerase sigma-70 factor (ECF subfamily)
VSQFNPIIQAAVIRSIFKCGGRPTGGLADDLVQESYLRLCRDDFRALRNFRSPNPKALYGLVQAVAVSVTIDHFRKQSTEIRGGGDEPIPLDLLSLKDLAHPSGAAAVETAVLIDQLDRRLQKILPPETAVRDRRIFWLYYRRGLTAEQIASLSGMDLSAKGVESVLHRLLRFLKE